MQNIQGQIAALFIFTNYPYSYQLMIFFGAKMSFLRFAINIDNIS